MASNLFLSHHSHISSDGTALTVSFTPVEYGKEKIGKLLIVTKDMYWYDILLFPLNLIGLIQ